MSTDNTKRQPRDFLCHCDAADLLAAERAVMIAMWLHGPNATGADLAPLAGIGEQSVRVILVALNRRGFVDITHKGGGMTATLTPAAHAPDA
jgi:hypothetical protein